MFATLDADDLEPIEADAEPEPDGDPVEAPVARAWMWIDGDGLHLDFEEAA